VLRPGARLVIETNDRDGLVLRWTPTSWRLMGEGRLLLEQRTFDPAAGVATTTQTLIDRAERDSRTWTVRVYTATELVAMLSRAGFSDVKCWGGFAMEPLTPESRLVIVATRSV
jgi:hypothetical protein